MAYQILIERKAEKDLKKLPKEIQNKIIETILNLKNNSRPFGVRKISDSDNYYRLRMSDYRIIYEINDEKKKINIFRIRHCKEVYSNL